MRLGNLRSLTGGALPFIVAGITACVVAPGGPSAVKTNESGAIRVLPEPPGAPQPHEGSLCDLPGNGDTLRALIGRGALQSQVQHNMNLALVQEAQRFADSPTAGYGPLACIIPVDAVEELTDEAYTSAQGAVVAILWLADSATTRAYTDLHLTAAGLYCLILKGSTANRALDAHVTRHAGTRCGPMSASNRLTAIPRSFGSGESRPFYPGVARFMLKQNHRPGIGITCNGKWCEIFPSGAPDSRAHAVSGNNPRRSRHEIPGWYDQQYLAVHNTAFPLSIKATVKASIVSDEELGVYDLDRFRAETLTVARVYMSGMVRGTKYQTVWKFTRIGPFDGNANTLALHLRADDTWLVFVNGALNPRLKVSRADHAGHFIPGVARWKWDDRDEPVWVRCAEGCCWVEET